MRQLPHRHLPTPLGGKVATVLPAGLPRRPSENVMPKRNQPAQSLQKIVNSICRKNKKRCRPATAEDRPEAPEATVATPNIAQSQTLAYDRCELFELRKLSGSAWMNLKLTIVIFSAVALLTFGSQASAQLRNQTIQLPVIRQFNVRTSVSCLLYTSPSPRDQRGSRMPSSA